MEEERLVELLKSLYEETEFLVRSKSLKNSRKKIKSMCKEMKKDPNSISSYMKGEDLYD